VTFYISLKSKRLPEVFSLSRIERRLSDILQFLG